MIVVVEGTVQHGDRRGRELGFPTANIHGVDAVRLDGVYAGILQVEPSADGPSLCHGRLRGPPPNLLRA